MAEIHFKYRKPIEGLLCKIFDLAVTLNLLRSIPQSNPFILEFNKIEDEAIGKTGLNQMLLLFPLWLLCSCAIS